MTSGLKGVTSRCDMLPMLRSAGERTRVWTMQAVPAHVPAHVFNLAALPNFAPVLLLTASKLLCMGELDIMTKVNFSCLSDRA